MNIPSDAPPVSAFGVSSSDFPDSFDVVVCGPSRVDYLLQLSGAPIPGADLQIEREVRCAGGEGLLCAVMLARWGLRVCLLSNPIGDDGSGRMISRSLEATPSLVFRAPIVADLETPYVVTLCSRGAAPTVLRRGGDGGLGSLIIHFGQTPALSPQAAHSLRIVLHRGRGDGVWCVPDETPRGFGASEAATSEPVDLLGEAGAEGVFLAGLAWAWLQGWPWERALSLAANALALKLRLGPGVESVPGLSDVLALLPPPGA